MALPLARSAEETPEMLAPSPDVAVESESSSEQCQRIAHLEKAVADTEKRLGKLSRKTTERIAGVNLRSNFLGTLRLQQGSMHDREMEGSLEGPRESLLPSNALSRIEALEAISDDLKHGIKDALAVADSTESLLTTAMDHEVEQLWRELRQLRAHNAAELQRVETSGAEALQRAQEVERQVEAMHQEQLAGHSSLKDAYSHAMLTIQEHSAEVRLQVTRQKEELTQDLHALHESRLKFTECEAENVKQAQHVANNAHKLVDEIALRLQDLEQQNHKQVAESAIVQLRLQEFERTHMQQHAGHSSNHVTKPVEEMLLQVQNLEQQLHRQAAEVEMLQPRLHELEHAVQQQQQHQSADAVAAQTQKGEDLLELVQSSLDELRLASTTKCVPTEQQISSVDLQEFTNRLLVLEGKVLRSDGVEAASAPMSDLEQMRKSLADTSGDVAMLARNIAEVMNNPPVKTVRFSGADTPASQVDSDISASKQLSDTEKLERLSLGVTSDLNDVRGMFSASVVMLQAMQCDMQDLRPRVSSLELQFSELQVEQQQRQRHQRQQQLLQVPATTTLQQLAENPPTRIATDVVEACGGPSVARMQDHDAKKPYTSASCPSAQAESLLAPIASQAKTVSLAGSLVFPVATDTRSAQIGGPPAQAGSLETSIASQAKTVSRAGSLALPVATETRSAQIGGPPAQAGSLVVPIASQAKILSQAGSLALPIATETRSAQIGGSMAASVHSTSTEGIQPMHCHACPPASLKTPAPHAKTSDSIPENHGSFLKATGTSQVKAGCMTDTSTSAFAMAKVLGPAAGIQRPHPQGNVSKPASPTGDTRQLQPCEGPAVVPCAALAPPTTISRNLLPRKARVLRAETLSPKEVMPAHIHPQSGPSVRLDSSLLSTPPLPVREGSCTTGSPQLISRPNLLPHH